MDQRWGRADRVAVAEVDDGAIRDWQEYETSWDALHDAGSEGAHHARIATFLKEHRVERVVAGHMGPPMQNMVRKMGIEVRLGVAGPARSAVASSA